MSHAKPRNPPLAVCYVPACSAGCYNGYVFQALQVPFLQTQGTSQGFHFDRDTMAPLVNSSGKRLWPCGHPTWKATQNARCLWPL